MKIKAQICMLLTCLAGVCIVSTQAAAGTLSATVATPAPTTPVNLTAEGTLDWAEWGFGGDPTAFNDMAPGGGPISNYKQIGDLTQAVNAYSPTGVPVLWDNGAPTLSASDDQEGIYVGYQGGNGFQITVQADPTAKFLKIYAGCYGEQLHLHAVLSDASAPAYDDYSLTDPTESGVNGVYTIKFAAASSGQTLSVAMSVGTNVFDTNYANTTLQAAALFGPAPAFAASQPASQTNWLGLSAQLTAQASGDPSIPLSYQWWVEAKGAYVPLVDGGQISGSGTPALTISNLSLANGTNYYVVVTNAYGAVTSSVAVLTVLPVTGTLLGDAATAPASVDLTALGALDWADWGVASGNPPNYMEQKVGGTNQISDLTLIGPAPNGPLTYNNALVAYSWSDGTPDASIAGTTTGIYFNDINNGYQITVPADQTNKILTVYAGGWNCQIQLEASLSDSSAPPYVSPALTCSTAQAADAYTIDFAAGSPGQTLTVNVYCLTGGGNCTLMAATLTGPKPFILTQPVSQTNWLTKTTQLTAVTDGGLLFSYQWWEEANGAYFPLSDGGQISGSATPTLTISNLSLANGTNYYVVITNVSGAVTSSVAALTVLPITGTLLGGAASAPGSINLTALGTLDWAAWGELSGIPPNYLEQKAGGTNQISDVTTIGSGSGPNQFGGALVVSSWSDGAPDAAETSTNGIYFNGVDGGYQFTVPADQTKKILTVFAGGWNCQVQLEASLSDFSAPPYIDNSLVTPAQTSDADAYTIEFSANSPGQTLTVSVHCLTDGGNCTLLAATLAGPKPFILAQPAPQTNNVLTTAQLTATAEGWPTLSYQWRVEANGAYVPLVDGGQFSGSQTPTLTISNLLLADGTNYYVVVTNAYGAVTSSVAALTVLPVTGTLIGSAATAPASVDLTALGTLDWADWGVASGNPPNYLEQKAGGTNQISDLTLIGPAPNGPFTYDNALVAYSWSDGTPDPSIAGTTTGVYFNNINNGYQITVPADQTNKILTVYAGGWNCQIQLQASLSDSSAPPYVSPALTCSTAQAADAYTIDFAAGAPGQTLTVNVHCLTDAGNCTLMAATLQEAPVSLRFGFTGSSLRLTWLSGALQQTTNLTGPWITTTATSPFTVTPSLSTPQMYYRVKAH